MNLSKSANKIEKSITLYPFLMLLFASITFITITYNIFEEYAQKEKEVLKKNLLENEKQRSKNQLIQVNKEIEYIKKTTKQKLKNNIKRKIDEASTIIDNIIKENPHKTKEELKKLVSIALSPIRFFNNRGYYFVYDRDNLTSVIHPIKSFIGKDMSKFKDKRGQVVIELYEDMIKKNDAGYVDIYFRKPNEQDEKEYKKTVYIKYIPKLNWVIGTGEYFDELEKKIKKETLEQIERVRYGKNGYFWIHNTNHTLIMHPFRKDSIGRYDIDLTDSKGTKIIQLFVNEAKKNKEGAFVKYYWQKPNQEIMEEKIGFVKLIPNWNWVIGTGVYLEDVNKLIKYKEKNIKEEFSSLYKNIFYLIFITLVITIIISYTLAKRTRNEFKKYSSKLHSIKNTLEDKVKIRTKELNDINEHLEERITQEVEKNRLQEVQILEQAKFVQMGEMIGNIAHQWRQPLSVISVVSSGLQIKIETDTLKKEEALEYLESLNKNAQYLSDTIDHFRDFIKEKRELKEIIVQSRIDNVIEIMETSLKNNFIKLINNMNYDKPLKKTIVLGELSQVVINIISNAKDALIQDKDISEKWIQIDCYDDEKNIYVTIEDNAKGIEEDILNKIFDPYFTTKHQSQGTGIGLYMSKTIIEHHLNGKLSVENTSNGAKFILQIPKDKKP